MASAINKRCPQCGRKPHDQLLVQCPDCRVPFVYQEPMELTPEQVRVLIGQIFGSWKFWTFLILLIGAGTWAVVKVSDRIIQARSEQQMSALQLQNSNQMGTALSQISRQMSNQVTLQFKQPRIKNLIDQTVRDEAATIFTNSIQPSIDAFQSAMDSLNEEIARASNSVSTVQSNALEAQRRIAAIPIITNVPIVATAPAKAPAAPAAIDTNSIVKLTLVNRTVAQAGNSYLLTLFFRTTNGPASGTIELMAGTYKQTAKILSFAAMSATPSDAPFISDAGDAARLRFNVTDREVPTVVIEFSAPTIVRIVSSSIDDLTIPIAAEKMQIPAANQ